MKPMLPKVIIVFWINLIKNKAEFQKKITLMHLTLLIPTPKRIEERKNRQVLQRRKRLQK